MDRDAFIAELKFKLTGGVLDCELGDEQFSKILDAALRETQRYICSTKLITIPFKRCINLSNVDDTGGIPIKVSSVARVFRTKGYTTENSGSAATVDPMQGAQWQLLSGIGNLNYMQDYMYNYMSWNTLQQIRNTTSTDLAHFFDRASNKLYINVATAIPDSITIEYIPRLDDVSEIDSDYWIDQLMLMAQALSKITIGRIRSKFTSTNALWQNDGQQILSEGLDEYNNLQSYLRENTMLTYGID